MIEINNSDTLRYNIKVIGFCRCRVFFALGLSDSQLAELT